METTMAVSGDGIAFGAHPYALQGASVLTQISENLSGTFLGDLCKSWADSLVGANIEGMDVIKDCVSDLSDFYGVDNVKVFFEPGEPGVHFSGLSDSPSDNWIGGDPNVLNDYARQYGPDFIQNVVAHEMGHFMFDKLDLDAEGYGRISNEAVADFLSGVYSGSKGLDPQGTVDFYSSLPDHPDYPTGDQRANLFNEGYELAQKYPFKDFTNIVNDPMFDLRGTVCEVANRYHQCV